jgi:hypothetical protein
MIVETQYFASRAIQSGFAIWICMRETQNIASLHPNLSQNNLLLKDINIFKQPLRHLNKIRCTTRYRWIHLNTPGYA